MQHWRKKARSLTLLIFFFQQKFALTFYPLKYFKGFSFYIRYYSLKRQLKNTKDQKKRVRKSWKSYFKIWIKASGFFIHSGGDVAIAEVLSARISQFWEMPWMLPLWFFFFFLTQDQSVFCCCSFFTFKESLGQIFRSSLCTWSFSKPRQMSEIP